MTLAPYLLKNKLQRQDLDEQKIYRAVEKMKIFNMFKHHFSQHLYKHTSTSPCLSQLLIIFHLSLVFFLVLRFM